VRSGFCYTCATCMALQDMVGLVGFFLGILLHLFLFSAFLRRRRKSSFELMLLFLIGGLLVWFSGNFMSVLLRQMDAERVGDALRATDVTTFGILAVLPALLLHTHWIYFRRRHAPRDWERRLVRLVLIVLYAPLGALPWVLGRVYSAPAGEPLNQVGELQLPFLLLLALAYYGAAFIGLRIMAFPRSQFERRVFRGLAFIFALVPVYNLFVFWQNRTDPSLTGDWLTLGVWLASLLPSSLIFYYIYRYQFLDIDTSRPLASALLILLMLALYITAVTLFGDYLRRQLGAPRFLLEVTLLAAILLFFPTLSRGLETLVAMLFSGEMRKYRQIGEMIHRSAPLVPDPGLFKQFVEDHLRHELGTSQVRITLSEGEPKGEFENRYSLVAARRKIGYLDISHPQTDSRAEREAMQFLANEIAVGLERCYSIEAQLRMERELAQKSHMEELGRMAASVAHNVKNPLSSMKTLLQLFTEAENLTTEQRDEAQMMIREVDRLSSTVTSLLKFSRSDLSVLSDKSNVPAVDLSNLAASLRAVFAGELQLRMVRLEIVADGPVLVQADPEFLTDVLTNLLLNAIEASPSGGEVTIRMRRQAAEAIIEIEDQGQGIPSGVRSRIFDPFVTTKSRGTGLGLSIVKKRVEQLHGHIAVESQTSGTRFTVTLPLTSRSEELHGY
jgi:signal transduction histidine kinase